MRTPAQTDTRQALAQERLRLHRQTATATTASVALAALAMALVLYGRVNPRIGLAWALGVLAVLVLRTGVLRADEAAAKRLTPDARLLRWRFCAALHGLVWMGAALAILQDTQQPPPLNLMVFALTAMAAGAMTSTAYDWAAGLWFTAPASWALVATLSHGSGQLSVSAVLMTLIFIGVIFKILRRNEAMVRENVSLREAAHERAEEAERMRSVLADRDQLMQQLLASTHQGCWFIDREGRTTEANDAMCELLGRTREELLGRHALDFFSGEDRLTLEREMVRRERGERGSYAITIERPDGTRRHCQNSATPLRDARGELLGAVGLWTDVTELVEANRALRVHAWAINSITDVVSVLDEREAYRMVNDTWCHYTGVPREKALGRTATELQLSVTSAARTQAIQRCLETDEVQTLRSTIEMASIRGRQLLTLFYPYGGDEAGSRSVVMVTRDVTDEERILRAAQSAEAEQRALLDAFPGYIARLDQGLVYRYVNERLAALSGTTPAAMVGRSVDELFPPERAAQIRRELMHTQIHGSFVATRRLINAVDQREVHVQITTALSRGPAGSEAALYAFATDVTGLHRARLAVDEARAEAERANRAKSQFLAQMSHELRTPMNAILGFAQLLDTDAQLQLGERQRSYLQQIRLGGEHLLGLINEVLELGRIESGELALQTQAVPLAELARDCLELMRPLAGARGVQLLPLPAVDADAGPAIDVAVLADPMRLKQVLLNLLGNAVKYNHAEGTVSMNWAVQGEQLRIEVHDTGPGIAREDQERVFEPFERLGAERTAVEGTGIGLALSRRLVLAMHGAIGVDSKPEHGSTFWLLLPLARNLTEPSNEQAQSLPLLSVGTSEAAAQAAASSATPGHAPLPGPAQDQRPVVLYIEDNPVNLVLMEAMLGRLSALRAICVISPAEGLALAVREQPVLVLLDLQMPGMDGFEVLRRLRVSSLTQAIPVVAVSANAHPHDIDAALAAGFDGYLTKPIDLHALSETVMGRVREALAARLATAPDPS